MIDMRNILLGLLFLASNLTAQSIDTSYTMLRRGYNSLTQDSAFYQTTVNVYDDGRIKSDDEILGDTLNAINHFIAKGIQDARLFSNQVNQVWSERKNNVIGLILQRNSILSSRFDTTIIEASVDIYGPVIDGSQWTITTNNSTATGVMSIAPSGNNLILTIGATNYVLFPVGDAWIRLIGHPSGSYTDLHRKQGSILEFRSVDEALKIVRN